MYKNRGLVLTCAAGSWSGDSDIPGLKLKFAALFFDPGGRLFVLGPFLTLQDISNNLKVQITKSIHRMVASRPKQVRALLSSTWLLHHVEGQLMSRKSLLWAPLFLLFTCWGLKAQGIKNDHWNWNKEELLSYSPTSVFPFPILLWMWNWSFLPFWWIHCWSQISVWESCASLVSIWHLQSAMSHWLIDSLIFSRLTEVPYHHM